MRYIPFVWFALVLTACSSSTATTHKVTPAAGATSAATTGATAPVDTYHVGDKIEISSGQTAQLYSIERPATSSNEFIKAKAGNELAAADVEICAGPNIASDKTVSANPFDFDAVMPDNTRINPSLAAREPALHQTSLQANDCVRGWVTFEVPQGTAIKQITYTGRTPDMQQIIVKWNAG